MYNSLAAGIQLGEIGDNVVRKKVPLESFLNKAVGNTSKGIFKVKKGDMSGFFLLPGILDDLFHSQIMFYASIYAREKGLLHCRINELILDEEGGEAGIEEQVKCFANATA